MTDEELRTYLGLDDVPFGLRVVGNLSATTRAVYERMHAVEIELNLWQAGIGPKPQGVIVCKPKRGR